MRWCRWHAWPIMVHRIARRKWRNWCRVQYIRLTWRAQSSQNGVIQTATTEDAAHKGRQKRGTRVAEKTNRPMKTLNGLCRRISAQKYKQPIQVCDKQLFHCENGYLTPKSEGYLAPSTLYALELHLYCAHAHWSNSSSALESTTTDDLVTPD